MTLICDAGAFVALERNDRIMWRRLKAELLAETPPLTHGGIVAQVWRGGPDRQVQLARAVHACDVAPLDGDLGRAAGSLLGAAQLSDAIDAALVALATDDDRIVTSDPRDILRLVQAAGRAVDVLPI
jgi:hypothetical protein